jgi:protein associated with RNAse G/E
LHKSSAVRSVAGTVPAVADPEGIDDGMVRVVFRKFDGSLHWHARLQRLGEDEHGVWLGAPDQTAWQRGSEPRVALHAHVLLIPPAGWWVASFNAAPAPVEVYVDVTTVPTWPGTNEVTMVDLDLDVVRRFGSGAVELLDEDEFEAHRRRYAYPDEVVHRSRETATWLLDAVVAGEPFATAFRGWLAMVCR